MLGQSSLHVFSHCLVLCLTPPGQLTGKHLQKLIKFFDDVSEVERKRASKEARKYEEAKERKKKGSKRTASMLVSML